ncbi:hypothetical protein H4Q26_004020 [Puccinia striiformis f. sp. tritici PST-130]|nr:hypothetical protein H4Q26_004020 [Puccinia striiformis f. sp. tritici PST-130]
MLDAFDLRNKEAVDARTGGILQLAIMLLASPQVHGFDKWATANFERMPELNATVWDSTNKKATFAGAYSSPAKTRPTSIAEEQSWVRH